MDGGYVSSYVVDSVDCGCGESVITSESTPYCEDSSTGIVVEESLYRTRPAGRDH